jgi:hypothetical protein
MANANLAAGIVRITDVTICKIRVKMTSGQ